MEKGGLAFPLSRYFLLGFYFAPAFPATPIARSIVLILLHLEAIPWTLMGYRWMDIVPRTWSTSEDIPLPLTCIPPFGSEYYPRMYVFQILETKLRSLCGLEARGQRLQKYICQAQTVDSESSPDVGLHGDTHHPLSVILQMLQT